MASNLHMYYIEYVKRQFLLLFICFTLLSTHFAGGQDAVSKPRRFSKITEVIDAWKPNQHVWVSGNLPVSATNLEALEKWVGQNGPNWTIVLMASASGQTYDGDWNIDAVEQALGRGLSNQTSFGEQVHPTTKEQNGAIFALFLAERKFSYFASNAYDRHSLGERHWIGQLDRPAIDAMRNGGRIVDAVKDTIRSIDGNLVRQINRENVSRELRKEKAKQLPHKLKQQIDAVTKRAAIVRSKNPEFHGPIAYPDETSWRVNLKAIELNLKNGEINTATNAAETVLKSIYQADERLNQWEAGKTDISEVVKRIAAAPKNTNAPRVSGLVSQAKSSLEAARSNHLSGDPLFIDQLEVARQSITTAERELKKFQADQQAAAAREKTQKITFRSIIGGLVAIFLGWLGILNRRRDDSRRQAIAELEKWQTNLRGKFNKLFTLMDRASIIHRCSENYTGTTKQLTDDSVHEVDELFIMSSATDRIIEQADQLTHPTNPITRLANKFSRRNYTKTMELLSSKSIGFNEQTGLRAILRPTTKNTSRPLVGNEKDYKPFTISFNELIEVYDDREANVEKQLTRLESCIDGLPQALEQGETDINLLSKNLTLLSEATDTDGFLPLNDLQEQLLPSIDRHLEESAKVGVHDPVEAMENSAIQAQQQLADATSLVDLIKENRTTAFPEISDLRQKLEANDFATEWIEDAYDATNTRIDQLSQSAIEQSIAEHISPLEDDLTQILGRVRNTQELSEQILDQLPASIKTVEQRVESVRSELANSLKLEKEDLLSEQGLIPEQRIYDCNQALGLIHHALNSGNIESAQSEVQNIELLLSETDGILNLSKSVVQNGEATAAEIETQISDIEKRLPEAKQIMETLASNYKPEVLLFEERFGERSSGQTSIEHCISKCETHLAEATELLTLARESHHHGALILAGGEYEKSANEAGFSLHQVALIKDHYDDLKKCEVKNREQYQAAQTYYLSLNSQLSDRRTIQATINSQSAIKQAQQQCAEQMDENTVRNPYHTNRKLKALHGSIAELEDKIEIDWNWFATAHTELAGAQKMIDAGKRLANLAKRDGITDSQKLTQAIDSLYKFEQQSLQWQVFLSGSHRDWQDAYRALIKIDTEVTHLYGVIEQELHAAQHAAQQLEQASNAISDLKNWRSSYRVRIDRSAGDGNFAAARNQLGSGNYDQAVHAARSAINAAQTALRQAQSRERQERAAEEARRRRARQAAEAARRAAAQRRMSSSSSIGSSRRSSPRPSPSSRPSSSSRGSSGSGFSRSGW